MTRVGGAWEGGLADAPGWRPGSRANGSFPKVARRLSEKSPAGHPPPHQPSPGGSASATPPQGGSDCPGSAGVPPAMLSLWPPLSFRAMLQAAHPAGGNLIGQAEGEPWRRSRLIQVGEMAEAVPGFVRAGRPRSQEPSSYDIVTPRAQNFRSILAPLVVEGDPSVFWSIRVYSGPFVVRLH